MTSAAHSYGAVAGVQVRSDLDPCSWGEVLSPPRVKLGMQTRLCGTCLSTPLPTRGPSRSCAREPPSLTLLGKMSKEKGGGASLAKDEYIRPPQELEKLWLPPGETRVLSKPTSRNSSTGFLSEAWQLLQVLMLLAFSSQRFLISFVPVDVLREQEGGRETSM